MFFDTKGKNTNTKWNVNDFVIGGGNRSRKIGTGVNAKEEYELANTIRKIDSKFSRTELDLDSIFKDLRSKRREMRARFKTLESDPENEAAFHKLDVDLMMAQVRITESKAKAVSDKFKHIRDEKKLNKDLLKGKDPETLINVNTTTQGNSPLANVKPASNNTVFRTNMLDPMMIKQPASNFGNSVINKPFPKKDESDATPLVSSVKENTNTDSCTELLIEKKNTEAIPITKSWDGRVTSTTEDSSDERSREVKYRLDNADQLLNKTKNIQGIDYNQSFKSLVNKKKKLEKKMFINTDTGEFYVRDFEILDDGSKQLSDTETPHSLMHLGVPEFNPRLKTVKTAYSDDQMNYELIDSNNDDMPEYYIGQWAEPDKARFLIPMETLELL